MTGMEHSPNTHVHPDFRLNIGFTEADNDVLRTGHSAVIDNVRSAGFGLKLICGIC